MANAPQHNTDLPGIAWPRILAGQKALVTGANSGIGEAVAIGLGRAGADVVVNFVAGEDAAKEVVTAIEGAGAKAMAVKADVSKEAEVQAMFKAMFDVFGTIDILVANAGLQRDAAVDAMTLEQWNTVIGVNLTGQFLQGGLHMLMATLAQELAPHRIRVNSIGPGAIRTPINKQAWETPAAYDDLMRLIPYKRIGEPADIARVAIFLASDLADYITGTTIFVDGGMTCYPGFATGG